MVKMPWRNSFSGLRPLDFAVAALVLSSGIFLSVRFFPSAESSSGTVLVNAAEDEYEFALLEDGLHEVDGKLGKTVFEVRHGKVRVLDSPCPNKTCVAQGFSDAVVCLPNKVSIRVVEGKTQSPPENSVEGFDAISR
ncbi:MAG: NusG domain II-containing protein [Treponema sp.]|nr:NusG domain II-containing protein [Treponema sp.]